MYVLLSLGPRGTPVLMSFIANMYSDFFAPPPKSRRDKGKGRAVPDDSPPRPRDSKVRFHEEVRVKMVKSHGNMTALYESDSDSDDDEEGSDIIDQDEQEVSESLEDGDGEEEEVGEESGESEDGEESEEQGGDAFETMERFKDDLFTDEGPEDTSKLFQYTISIQIDVVVTQIFRHLLNDSWP